MEPDGRSLRATSQPSGQEEEAVGDLRRALENPHGTISERRDRIGRAWSSLQTAATAGSSNSNHRRKRKEQEHMRRSKRSKPAEDVQDEKVQLLMEASQRGDVEKVKQLLQDGLKVTAKDTMGYTALHWASLHGHPQVVRVLLNSGAGDGSRINRRTKSGNTALHCACNGQHLEVASMLYLYQPDVYAVNDYGQTPITLGLRKLLAKVEAAVRIGKVQATREQAPELRLRSAGLEMGMNAHNHVADSEAGPGSVTFGKPEESIMAMWEAYERAWSSFAEKYANVAGSDQRLPSTSTFSSQDVPWPYEARSRIDGNDNIQLLLAHLSLSGPSLRALVQQERLRWHPDKFAQMFGRNIVSSDRDTVLSRVQVVCQLINDIASKFPVG